MVEKEQGRAVAGNTDDGKKTYVVKIVMDEREQADFQVCLNDFKSLHPHLDNPDLPEQMLAVYAIMACSKKAFHLREGHV